MDIRVLGPLEVVADGHAVALGGSKQRALLALLILHANVPLAPERLIDELWGDRPPATAPKALQVHVSRLRRVLPADVIATRSRGYELVVDPEQIDAVRFERAIERARREPDPAAAARQLDAALGLWRGPPLADLMHEPFARLHADRLEGLRLTALELRTESLLATGQHQAVIAELEALIAEQPYREGLRAQLMVALYRADRQADALAAFHDARETLVNDLGIEPGEHLRSLQRAILDQAPELAAPRYEPERTALPVGLRFGPDAPFVARERELAQLRELWAAGAGVAFVTGEAGIGKTRLAAAFAASIDGLNALYGRCGEELAIPYAPFVEALGEADFTHPDSERQALFERVVADLSQRAPVLLVLDDLQWADEPSLALLRHVLRARLGGICVLALYREPGLRAAQLWAELRGEDGARRISMAGLDESAVARLLPPGDARLAGRIRSETNGNPFYVRELAAHLADSGELETPDEVREVILARVGRLTPDAQRLLSAAAVIGAEFSVGVLEVVLGGDVLDALDEAVAAGLLVERGHGDYAFAHALTRQALYTHLSAARRARLHRQVGEALEARANASVQELAHHFAEAADDGQAGKAADYAIAAARDAIKRGGYEQAAEHGRRGLVALERAGPAYEPRRRELRRLVRLTRHEPLPELGAIPAWLWGRLSRAGKVAVASAGVVALVLAVVSVPLLVRAHQERTRAAEAREAREHAALLASVIAEQRPHRARGPAGSEPRLLAHAVAAIATEARTRRPRIKRVECAPNPKAAGVYRCLAVTADLPAGPRNERRTAGEPYGLRIDAESGRYAYCRISPHAIKSVREDVPLAVECGGPDRPKKVQGQPG